MGAAATTPPTTQPKLTDQPLDALIPAPIGPWRKLVVSVVLIALAIGATVANHSGILYPRPFAGISFNTGGAMILDTERDAVGVFVGIPNRSNRDLRITNVTLDAPGAELIGVTYVGRRRGAEHQPIPAAVPVEEEFGDRQGIWVFFRPTTCEDPTEAWGFAEVTFDFGEGSFPPISTTHRVEDELWSNNGGSTTIEVHGTLVDGDGPLSLACEVLR